MLSVKTKSVSWQAKQIFRLVTHVRSRAPSLSALACGGDGATATAGAEAASGRWCSPRRRASGTPRSPTGVARDPSARPRPWLHGGYDRGRRRRFTPTRTGALRRRDLPVDHRHADRKRARNGARSSATSARGGGFVGVHAASDTRGTGPGTSGSSARASSATTPASPREPCRSRTARQRRDARPARRVDAHRRVVRVPHRSTPARARAGEPRRTRPLAWCHRYDGGRSVYTAMGHTKASFAEPRFLAPPARRDRDGRRPREVRLCALSALARACVIAARWPSRRAAASDAADRRPTAEPRPRSPTEAPRPTATADRRTPPPPAVQRRLEPRDQLGHGRPRRRHDHGRHRPGAVPRRPGRQGGRAHRRHGQHAEGNGTVSGQPRGALRRPRRPARLRPPAGGRRCPRTSALIRSQRPRRRPGRPSHGTAEADYHELEIAGELIVAVNAESPDIQVSQRRRRRRWRRSTPPAAPIDVVVDPERPAALGGLDRAGHVRLHQRRRLLAPARHDVRRPPDLAGEGRALQRRPQRQASASAPTAAAAGTTAATSADCRARSRPDAEDELLVGVVGGKIRRSSDGGRTWSTAATLR